MIVLNYIIYVHMFYGNSCNELFSALNERGIQLNDLQQEDQQDK